MILTIAWRNIWRNKLRSSVLIIAMALGLSGGIISVAIMNGMFEDRIKNAIYIETSHLQIHQKDYLINEDEKYIIPNAQSLIDSLKTDLKINCIAGRTKIFGMVTTAHGSAYSYVNGVIPQDERILTKLKDQIIDGEFFIDNKKGNQIIISKKIADDLKLDIGSKPVISFANSKVPFKVVGIFKTTNSMFDGMQVFVPRDNLVKNNICNENSIHEIAILLNDDKNLNQITSELNQNYNNLEARTWIKIQPEVGMMVDMLDTMAYSTMAFILLALTFGIVNTMLMVILERTKEIGMLMAIGMSRARVFLMIIVETILLSLVGAIIGMILSLIPIILFQKSGLNLSAYGEGMEAMGYSSLIYPTIEPGFFIGLTIMVIITAVLASLYPALKALKLNPVQAIRSEI